MDTKKLREFDPEFAKLLKKAIETGEPFTVTIDESVVTLMAKKEETISNDLKNWDDYDPKRVREALADVVGIFSEEKADAMIKQLYEAREAGSRPANRP